MTPARIAALLAAGLAGLLAVGGRAAEPPGTGIESLDLSPVPAGFPVGFGLLTAPPHQFVAYFDAEHRMTVATRRLDESAWHTRVLPSTVGWDSHNYLTLAADRKGRLHLSGNMHCVPLVYFRGTRPWDIDSLEALHRMTGNDETRCTYPKFMTGPDGRLLFHYRDGGSGNGAEIFNRYDEERDTWSRLLDHPLTDGQGAMNAYLSGPAPGPDGWYHLCWVWRDTPDCATNHDLSYARSRDLLHWEGADGRTVDLPMTLGTPGLVVDPIPPRGGLINGCAKVGFDRRHRPVLTFHKFDADGNTQAYAARFVKGEWYIRCLSDWTTRWDFSGGGSIVFDIHLGAAEPHGEHLLALPYSHHRHGSGLLLFDEQTFEPRGRAPRPRSFPDGQGRPESDFPGLRVKWARDLGRAEAPGVDYLLRWETLPNNRDRKPAGPLPEPSMLRLLRWTRNPDTNR